MLASMFEEETRVDVTIFAPHVKIQVETLISEPNVGLGRKSVEVKNPRTTFACCPEAYNNCDLFDMIIPYAGAGVECSVVFQESDPDCPPDFIFSDSRFFLPMDQMETLSSWDKTQPDSLLRTVKEILQLYKKRQIEELEKYEYLSFQYLCLFQLQNFNEDDIEIFVPQNRDQDVHFLIRLHVDMQSLMPDFFSAHMSPDVAFPLLFVSFSFKNSTLTNQRLYLLKEIEELLEMDEIFLVNDDLRDNSLVKYIMNLEKELRKRAMHVSSTFKHRKLYFEEFLSYFEKSIVEYDTLHFNSMVLLLNHGDFHFLVELSLPQDFPIGTPALIFRSVYQTFEGKPVTVAVDSYPYSFHWPLRKRFEETVQFIQDYAPLFEQDCLSYAL